jgi:hypothetical protein
MLDKWMKLNDTDLDLRECIYEFSMGRGGLLMEEICIENGYDERYKVMARAQDSIGWRRFMEGMVFKEIRAIECTHSSVTGLRSAMQHRTLGGGARHTSSEVTHGQWLYRNVQIHDRITGTLATQQKEELQMEIE